MRDRAHPKKATVKELLEVLVREKQEICLEKLPHEGQQLLLPGSPPHRRSLKDLEVRRVRGRRATSSEAWSPRNSSAAEGIRFLGDVPRSIPNSLPNGEARNKESFWLRHSHECPFCPDGSRSEEAEHDLLPFCEGAVLAPGLLL